MRRQSLCIEETINRVGRRELNLLIVTVVIQPNINGVAIRRLNLSVYGLGQWEAFVNTILNLPFP
jgi:hypothetical protein